MALEAFSRNLWLPAAGIAMSLALGACLAIMPLASANAMEITPRDRIEDQLMFPKGFLAVPDTGRIALPAIQFEYDSDRLTETAVRQLMELGLALGSSSLQALSFSIQGHTDSAGSDAYNRELSLRRARSVKRYLVREFGLSADRLIEVGLGESFPLQGTQGENRRNRRVEIVNLGIAAPPGNGYEHEGAPRKRALLIGIDAYRHVGTLLGAPVNDAREMASFLISHLGYQESDIRMLVDEQATRDRILAAITDWLVGGTRAGDEVFLFFSGHGFQEVDESGDEADLQDETLVPVEAYLNANGGISRMITDDEVAALLDRLAGRRIHVVLDSCHSGTATKSAADMTHIKSPRLPDGTPVPVAGTKGITGFGDSMRSESFLSSNAAGLTVWTASQADQKALVERESAGPRGSVFTRLFLRGVGDGRADSNEDGSVTVRELRRYLVDGSSSYCKRHPADCALGLTPQLFAAASRLDEPAFPQRASARVSWTALLAKDILVQRADRHKAQQVRIRMIPGPRVGIGEEIQVVVESERNGYLVLVDVDAAGRLVQLYPNEFAVRGGEPEPVRAGQPFVVPGSLAGFRYRATYPAGRGMLIAVVSEESAPLRNMAFRHKDLSVVSRPEAYLVELAEALRLRGVAAEADGSISGNGWMAGKLDYEIVSKMSF